MIIFFFPVPGLRPLLAGVRTLSAFHWSTSEEKEERERKGGKERGEREGERERGGREGRGRERGRERERERERGGRERKDRGEVVRGRER